MKHLKMWKDYRAFEIDVEPGWQLCLGRNVKIPLAEGHYYGLLGDGFEIRKDKNFICERPLYMIMDDPHPELLDLWSAKQDIYGRDDCVGYVPNGLLPIKDLSTKNWRDYKDDSDYGDESGEEDQVRSIVDSITYLGITIQSSPVQKPKKKDFYDPSQEVEDIDLGKYEEEGVLKVPTADCDGIKMRNAVFLGAKIPVGVRLILKEVMPSCLFTVHDEKKGDMYGYLIHMLNGIAGPDFEGFHSDEGYYEVSVIHNADHNPVDFIALMGNQNELCWYDMDRLEGRVDIDDLSWFDQHVVKFTDCAEWGPDQYPNNKFCGSSCSGSLSKGIYAIVPTKMNGNYLAGWSNGDDMICSCKSTTGVDSLGRKYQFPDKAFKVMKIRNNNNLKRYKDYLIDVSQGGHISVDSGIGNVEIELGRFDERKRNREERKHWEFDDTPVFRMFADINYAYYCPGDWSEYDADPDKTIAKYEAARRKAHDGYYKLPPKEPCCEACNKYPMHRRCPKESTVNF